MVLSKEAKALQFPSMFRQEQHIDWQLTYTASADLRPEDFLSFPDFPSVILIEANDNQLIDTIQSMEMFMLAFIKNNPAIPLILSPVIMVFRSPAALCDTLDFPDFVSDWIFKPVVIHDLVRRILFCLKKKNILKNQIQFGSLTLTPETRSISHEDRTVRLTPSEYKLAELFLTQMGAVVSFEDLVTFFKSSGKSTRPNNIRVTVFQLRLKLEILTKSKIILASIYGHGYCLRQKRTQPGEGSSGS
jgi:DNA-binding winged helix-turn-helix (wHTH) protein